MGDGKLRIAAYVRMWYIYLSVYICAVRSYPGSVRKILRTRLKGNGRLEKQAVEVLA